MTDLAPLPPPVPLPSPPDEARPAHYRLSSDTWEIICREYREGATAPFLARKWRVSEHAIRKRVTMHGATKRAWGDAQAIGQALAREAELEEARRNSPEAVAARLFEGVGALDEAAAGDPAVLARLATLASGRAMTGRLWAEARALSQLAEAYGRLAARQAAGRVTLDTVPLELIAQVAAGPQDDWLGRMSLIDVDENDPDNDVRDGFWRRRAAAEARRRAELASARADGVGQGRREAPGMAPEREARRAAGEGG